MITASIPTATYTGDGVTTTFAFGQRIYSAAELLVYTYTPGVDTIPQRVTTGFTTTVAADCSSANTVFATAPAVGVKVGLLRATALSQPIDISDTSYVPPSVVEQQLDRQAMMAQEAALFDALGLPNDPFDWTKTSRAGMTAAFDSNGDPAIGPSLADVSAAGAAATTAVAASATAVAAKEAALGAVPDFNPSTLAALKSDFNASTHISAYLLDGYRGGQFVFRSGNFSAAVAGDPASGVVVAADSVPSSTGALFRLYNGGVFVNWFGATGNGSTATADMEAERSACQAAINYVAAQGGGTILFDDGTYVIGPTTAPDFGTYGLYNGLTIPFGTSFQDDARIRLQGTGRTTLKAGASSMSVVRVSRVGTDIRGIHIHGGNNYWAAGGLTGTYGILAAVENRTDATTLQSQSFLTLADSFVEQCAEGLYYECGPTVAGAGEGAFYPTIFNTVFNANTRHAWFGAGALAPDNRPTRGVISACRFVRGAIGIDFDFVTEYSIVGCSFELLNSTYTTSPRAGICCALYVGINSELNTLLGGTAEDCDFAIYIADGALPNALMPIGFPPAETGVNHNVNFAPVRGAGMLRLTRITAAYQRVGVEAHHSGFAGLYFDLNGDSTRNAGIRTNDTTRQDWGPSGGSNMYGTDGTIAFNANGRTISSSATQGLSLAATASGAPVVLSAGGTATAIAAYPSALQPVAGAANLGISATNTTGRWNNLYLQNNPDIASDARYKFVDPDGWSDAELRVAQRLAGMIRAYKLRPEFIPEGEVAKRTAGVIAQEVIAAFAAEGLDANDYAMISNGEYYGVSYGVVFAFIIAGQNVRATKIEARLAALEAALAA